jgi:Bacterial Ig-like domain
MRSEGSGMRMRRVILLLATMCLTLLLLGGVVQAQPAPGEVPDASCPTNNETYNSILILTNDRIVAQTFTAQHTGLLTSAQVPIRNVGSATTSTNSIFMEIRAVDSSGTPTGVVLASVTIPPPDIPPLRNRVVTGHFSPGAPVEAGQQYAIALHTPNKPDSMIMTWIGNHPNPCPGESYEAQTNAPGEFGPDNMNVDHFFSTFVTLPDATPPKVISTVPKASADEVAPTANVRATFSEAMKGDTIDETTFTLFKKGTTTQIPATVSYNADTDTAKLDPTNNLERGVAYKAVVSTSVTDEAGNRLDQDDSTSGLQQKRWFFTVDD